MKWISIIGAAAVLVVSVFIVGLATANDHIESVPNHNTSKLDVIKACESFVGVDAGVRSARPGAAAAAARPSKYKMLLGVIEDKNTHEWKVQAICPNKMNGRCPQKSEGYVAQDLNAKLKVDVRLYEGSCWVCAGGFCFKVC